MILETRALTKRFGTLTAVDDLSLAVEEGDIFGFLGPNGAGKTTTIRMLLRLIPRTSGEILVFGQALDAHWLEIARRVGAIVEEPAFYPYLTGRKNLEVFGRLSGGVPRGRVDEVLARVGLDKRGDDKVRVYSQGMRQRLGIAQALLAQPRLLFLDEPTNGLDPPGIQEMRELLTRLAREEKVTVFVSSHLLAEVEVLCNRVAILDRGRLVVQGQVGALHETENVRLEIGVEGPVEPAVAALRALGRGEAIRGKDPSRLVVVGPRAATAALARGLVERGIGVTALIPRRPTLEEYFRERLALPAEGAESAMIRTEAEALGRPATPAPAAAAAAGPGAPR